MGTFEFYEVAKDEEYDIVIPILERGFYKFLVPKLCWNIKTENYVGLLSSCRFKNKFLKAYRGNFQEPLSVFKRLHKNLNYRKVDIVELVNKNELAQILSWYQSEFNVRAKPFHKRSRKHPECIRDLDERALNDQEIQMVIIHLINQLVRSSKRFK